MQGGAVIGKAAEDDPAYSGRCLQRLDRGRDRDPRRPIGGKPIDTGGNGRKGNRREAMGPAKPDRADVTRRQRFVLALVAGVPDRANGVNHVPRRQAIGSRDLGAAGLTTVERAAFGEKPRSRRAMDRTIHATPAEQRPIGGVDDGVNAQCRDVGDNDFEPRRADLARSQIQAAGALTVTPLSANSCCNSPAWNISRMMSQPPTNSPLT